MNSNRGYKVPPRTTKSIRDIAHGIRDALGLTGALFPIARVLEALQINEQLELIIVEDDELGENYAVAYPEKRVIKVRNTVYERAVAGDGFARFTLAHELGHMFLHKGVAAYARSKEDGSHKTYCDSEWQADKFAQELLIDTRMIASGSTASDIQDTFGVSYQAAITAIRALSREGVF